MAGRLFDVRAGVNRIASKAGAHDADWGGRIEHTGALAVGQSTTKAVVMGIVLIVVCASILTVIYINLGI